MTEIIKSEFNGSAIQFTDDGWFNATLAANKFGKRVDHWLANQETAEYIAALCESPNTRNYGDLIKTKRGNAGGTWLHPKLAVMFARWLDVRFAVWCDEQIDTLLRRGQVVVTAGEISHWKELIELERSDAESKAMASAGSRLMLARKKLLPMLATERNRLKALVQRTLFPLN